MKKAVKILIAIISAVLLVWASVAITLALQQPTQAVEQPLVKIYTPTELLAEANKLRAEKGVAPLKLDERLNASAAWKAQDMAVNGYFGHVKPGEAGNNGLDIANGLVSKDCSYVSENIHSNSEYGSPFNVAGRGWVNSKPHYEAIVDIKYDTTGFGAYQKDNRVYYVEHFCDLR